MRSRKVTTTQVIDKALDLLDERGWIKGGWGRGVGGGVCVQGAIDEACGVLVGRSSVSGRLAYGTKGLRHLRRVRAAAMGAVETVILAEGLVRYVWENERTWGPIPGWNDHFDTTVGDVKRVLGQAKDRVLAKV